MLFMILCFSLFSEYFYCCWYDNQGNWVLKGPLSLGNTNDNFPFCVSLHAMSNAKSFFMRETEEKIHWHPFSHHCRYRRTQEENNCAFLICDSLSRLEGIRVWEVHLLSCLLLYQSLISRASVWEIVAHSA